MNRAVRTLMAAVLFISHAAHAETIAIVNATAWTLKADAPIENATIVMSNGRIESIAPGAAPPAGATIVDAAGGPVTPGLMHAASHLGLLEVGAASDTVDHTAKSPQAPGAAFDVQYAINAHATQVRLARADGLARAVSIPSGSATPTFDGVGIGLRLLEHGDIREAPHTGVFTTIGRNASTTVGSRAAQWQLLRSAFDAAKGQLAQPPSPATRPPETLALEPVLAGKTPLAVSANRASDLREAARFASDYAVRVVILGGAEAWLVAQELAAAKVAVVLNPTSNLPLTFDELGARLDNAALLHRAGVRVAFTVGSIHSYNAAPSIREGAGIAVANGLPYVEGLRAITLNPALIWGVAERYGVLEPGKDADVVIWDADPLEPSSAPVAVFVQGRRVSQHTRQTELRDRYMPEILRLRQQGAPTRGEPDQTNRTREDASPRRGARQNP